MRAICRSLVATLILGLCLAGATRAQGPLLSDLEAIRINQADLPGFEQLSPYVRLEPSIVPVPISEQYLCRTDDWHSEAERISVQCIYTLAPTRTVAKKALGELHHATQLVLEQLENSPVAVDSMFADVLPPSRPYTYVFSMDRVAVRINVFAPSNAHGEVLAERLMRTVHQRLWDAGVRPVPPMALESETVRSGRVNFATGETFTVDYRVATDPAFFPAYSHLTVTTNPDPFSLQRQNRVADLEFEGQTGTVIWDGLDDAGQRFPDGDYPVEVELRDVQSRLIKRQYLVPVRSQAPPPITLQLQVLSKHVKPHKGEFARVQATATSPPTSFSYSVYRGSSAQGQPVFVALDLTAPGGSRELVWDGTDANQQRVPNGSYTISVTARNGYGGTATRTAHVVVNFQGQSLIPPIAWLGFGAGLATLGIAAVLRSLRRRGKLAGPASPVVPAPAGLKLPSQ
ncbi:MAG: hypothetical protein CMLOHMNK_03332 [Steroidobacteraceae bacterium]|nr:hypothetical protein [Steroidobacteraceae bacterium]